MEKLSILQWNIRGLINNYLMLRKLLLDSKAQIICVQETNFKENFHKKLKKFHCYFKNRINAEKASGGVAIYVYETLHTREIPIISNLEVIAVEIILNK